jgi:hypothetical protein
VSKPGITETERLAGVAAELGHALRSIALALEIVTSLQHDYRGDPRERAAIALLSHSGRMAELWHDLRAELEVAEGRLSSVVMDLDIVMYDALAEGEPDLNGTDAQSRPTVVIPFLTNSNQGATDG